MKIRVDNFSKKLGMEQVLDDINVTFESGNSYGIIGANGCGKTMLLRAICGFIKPDSGGVYVDNKLIGEKNNEYLNNVGIIIGEVDFYPDLSGIDNLRLLANIKKKINDNDIELILQKVGLFEAKDRKYRKYSLGMKQRLRIAQALMEKEDILILDEPFNGLDKKGTEEIRQLIKENAEGKLLIMTSHNEKDIEILCDSIITMDGGKIIE